MLLYHHVYNRGAHKETIFGDASDYERMLKLLYIANNTQAFEIKWYENVDIFKVKKKRNLVDIIAYCLMPNHIHLALYEREKGGISKFMQKLATGYSAYINKKYDHSGTIWQGSYNEKVVDDDVYIRKLINYIHLNPFALKDPTMTKEARAEHLDEAIKYSEKYTYSSFKEYLGERRQQSSILSRRHLIRFAESEV